MNDAAPGRDDRAMVPGARVVGYCLAILSVATAVIHFAVAGAHFHEYWVFGVFMLVVAWLQLLWAAGIVVRPSRWLLWTGAIVNAAVIVVYVVTRTVGDVIGPTPHAVEPVGFGDALCTALEVIVVAGCLGLLVSATARPVRREHLIAYPTMTGTAAAVLLSVALVAGGPEMVMTAAAGSTAAGSTTAARAPQGMRMPASQTSAIHLATTSPAGDITMPDPNMQMAAGMQMASPTACDAVPTAAQQAVAVRLVNASWQDSRRFRSLNVARTAGYVPITPPGLPVVHYLNYKYYLATLQGGPVLNVAEPQSLVYANTPKGAVLVAAMYIAPQGRATPQPGGCLTQWHVHTNLCTTAFGVVVGLLDAAHSACPAGSANHVTPPMMHVWYVPIPGGPTAIDATDAQVVSAAERVGGFGNGPA
jgi:hypothetical protein